MQAITFKIATTEDEIGAARKIRTEVFVIEQGIPAELDLDSNEDRSIILLAMAGTKCIGTGRLTINKDDGILSRISVIKKYRNHGIGKSIISELEIIANQNNVQTLTLTPHIHLEDFYVSLGYKKAGEKKAVGKYMLLNMSKAAGGKHRK